MDKLEFIQEFESYPQVANMDKEINRMAQMVKSGNKSMAILLKTVYEFRTFCMDNVTDLNFQTYSELERLREENREHEDRLLNLLHLHNTLNLDCSILHMNLEIMKFISTNREELKNISIRNINKTENLIMDFCFAHKRMPKTIKEFKLWTLKR